MRQRAAACSPLATSSSTSNRQSGKAPNRFVNQVADSVGGVEVAHPVHVVDRARLPDGERAVEVLVGERRRSTRGRSSSRPSCAPTSSSPRPRPSLQSNRISPPSAARELRRLGDRHPAGEALADVGGGAALDRRPAGHQLRALAALGAAREHQVRARARAHGRGELLEAGAVARGRDQRDLAHRASVEVDRPQQVGDRLRVARGDVAEAGAKTDSAWLGVAALAGERGEAQQAERGGGVAGRDRVVVDVLAPGDQLLVIVRGGEEAAAARGRRSARSSRRRSRARRRTSARSKVAS